MARPSRTPRPVKLWDAHRATLEGLLRRVKTEQRTGPRARIILYR
jgi:hypothetical protein